MFTTAINYDKEKRSRKKKSMAEKIGAYIKAHSFQHDNFLSNTAVNTSHVDTLTSKTFLCYKKILNTEHSPTNK